MAIGDDFSIAENGDIRYTGTVVNYTPHHHLYLLDGQHLYDRLLGSHPDL